MRLSAERIAAAVDVIAPALQHTPVVQLSMLGCDLVLKDETAGPLGCFKGRGADLFVSQLEDRMQGSSIVCASAGNFGLALADAGLRRGVRVTVFVSTHANAHKVARIRELGGEVIVAGHDFDAAKDAARASATSTGSVFVEDGDAIAISEGAGTIAAELDAPLDAIVVPVGNGALIAGIGTWMRAHHPSTRVIGVCAAGAPVMRTCWEHRRIVTGARAETIADGIAVRVPVPAAIDDVAHVIDDFVAVDDNALVDAMRALYARTGIAAEPSAVAGLAAIAATPARFAGMRVATIVTGKNLTREQHERWLG